MRDQDRTLRQALERLVSAEEADDGGMSSTSEYNWGKVWAKRLRDLLTAHPPDPDLSTALLALVQQWRELDSEIANRFADQLERLITGEGK